MSAPSERLMKEFSVMPAEAGIQVSEVAGFRSRCPRLRPGCGNIELPRSDLTGYHDIPMRILSQRRHPSIF
jgi:hypothetical protein